MRGNSGFLRWLPSCARSANDFRRHTTLMVVILALLAQSSHAGPVNTRHRRMMREVYTDFETKNQTDVQPEAGTCFLDGELVPESTVHCDKKPGCRVIQKTGYCCPDYQCECERDGRTYSNGEKLVDPNTPCKVCYCQGGEITCSNVSCYARNDCEPKYVPGRCCPEYDNCPPLEHVKPAVKKETSPENQPTLNAPAEHISTSSLPPVNPEIGNNNPLGIKIKEITKPEEIRIIDEKPKQVFPITKPSDTVGNNQVKVENGDQSQDIVQESLSPTAAEKKLTNGASGDAVNKLEMADVNAVNDEDSQKTVRHTGAVTDGKNESPESPEAVSGEDKKAAATQAGKEVVIVDSNGNSKPITVFGIEGLQRGDVMADGVLDNGTSSEKDDDKKPAQDLDIAASSSDNIRVLPLDPHRSTERTTEDLPVNPSAVFDTVLYTAGPESVEDSLNVTGVVFDTVLHEEPQGTGLLNVSNEGPSPGGHHPHHMDDYDSTSNEPNPAYPTIEDDLSNYGREDSVPPLAEDYLEASHKGKSAEQADEPQVSEESKVSTEGLESPANKTQLQALGETKISTEGSESASPKREMTTEGLPDTNLSDVDQVPAESRLAAPGEPLLIPEWERNTTTEASSTNETDATEDGSRDDIIDAGSGSGGGSGFGQIRLESAEASLKGISVIDEFEDFLVGTTSHHSSMSAENMGDDPNTDADSITYSGGVGDAGQSSLFQDSLQKAIETVHTWQNGYLNVF